MIVLLMVLGAAIVYAALSFLYKKNWNKDLSIQLQFSSDHAIKGDQVELVEVITNAKRLPLPIVNVKFQVDRSLNFGNKDTNTVVSDKSYRNDIFSLLMNQKVTRRIPVTCTKRGVFDISKMEIVSTGAFMKDLMVMSKEVNAEITVYPSITDTSRLQVVFQTIQGTVEKNKHLYEDKFVFRGIRDYEVYDSLNTINWKASARSGELMVNQYNETICQDACILLNLEPEGMHRDDRKFEECISLAAGLAQMFIEQGVKTELITNGVDTVTGEYIRVYPGAGFSHLNMLNTALARIDENHKIEEFVTLIDRERKETREQKLYVMISMNIRQNLQDGYELLTHGCNGAFWIVPCYNGEEKNLDHNQIEMINWEISR